MASATKASRLAAEASLIRRNRMRPMALPSSSQATATRAFVSVCRPRTPFLQPTDVGLVHFHPTVEPITPRSHHGSPKFVQPCPGGEVAAQTQYALQPQGAGSILLRRHPPDGPEPHRQRFPRILEDRARRQRRLVLAASADQQVAVSRPSRSPATAWADKTLRPTQLQKVVPTRLFGSKPGLQFGQSTRVFLHSRLPQHIGLLESTEYPDRTIRNKISNGHFWKR